MNYHYLIKHITQNHDKLPDVPTDNNYINLYDPLKASYETHNEAEQRLKKYGYNYDHDLSNDETKIFHNPDQTGNKKLLVTFRGSVNVDDWVNSDRAILLGGFTDTRRYKDSKNKLHEAKQKYNLNGATLFGHSLGGSLASSVGDNNDDIYTFNKGNGALFNHNTQNKNNEHAYRWNGDVVSVGSYLNKNKSKTLGYQKKNIVLNHDISNIKDSNILI